MILPTHSYWDWHDLPGNPLGEQEGDWMLALWLVDLQALSIQCRKYAQLLFVRAGSLTELECLIQTVSSETPQAQWAL